MADKDSKLAYTVDSSKHHAIGQTFFTRPTNRVFCL